MMRFDNGQPFGVPDRSTISVLSLWLIGLGINVHFNRPRTPQENAKVERNQGTTARWSDYKKCSNLQQLQQKLDYACKIQRDKYPLDRHKNKTRKELFPELYNNKNIYNHNFFSIQLVLNTLSEGIFVRRVSQSNQFTFYGLQPTIPKGYAHQDIVIKLDAKRNCWFINDRNGSEIKQLENNFITQENILKLTICQRTDKT
jgi:hypothetical protein